jgi:hypothetical protein
MSAMHAAQAADSCTAVATRNAPLCSCLYACSAPLWLSLVMTTRGLLLAFSKHQHLQSDAASVAIATYHAPCTAHCSGVRTSTQCRHYLVKHCCAGPHASL